MAVLLRLARCEQVAAEPWPAARCKARDGFAARWPAEYVLIAAVLTITAATTAFF
jgi:hypothetical protein